MNNLSYGDDPRDTVAIIRGIMEYAIEQKEQVYYNPIPIFKE